jgi:cell division protein FtsZ
MSVDEGFKTVDEVLTTATKSIAEIITTRGGINTDFRDVNKILKNGGVAIMSYGIASGEMRVSRAFHNALHSPLLNNSDIYKAKKILFNIYGNPNSPMLVEEMGEIEAFMQKFTDKNIELIWGYSKDHNLGDGEVKVTVLATGFGMKDIPGMESEVETIKEEKKNLSQQEEERIKQEDEKLDHMVSVLYKPDYKVYIFKGDEMYNEEFIAALDNSPTYKRTAQELERMVATLNEVKPIPENIEDKETVKIEEEEDFTPGVPVYYNDESVKEMDDENN